MAPRIKIATKIFGLAIFLLCLMIGLSVFSTHQVSQLRSDLTNLAENNIPFADLIADFDVSGVRRRLAFERLYAQANLPAPDPSVVQEASQNYATFTENVKKDLVDIRRELQESMAAAEPEDLISVARLESLTDEIASTFDYITRIQEKILTAARAKDFQKARLLYDEHSEIQKRYQERRAEIRRLAMDLSKAAAARSLKREKQAVLVTQAATGAAILFGLVFAYIITRRMVQPVESLLTGVQNMEKGDLSIQLPVLSTDEIGALTYSFNNLAEQLRGKAKLQETFGKYVDPRIVEKIILNPDASAAIGNRRIMTIGFSDLVGFTTIGEQLTPAGLVNLLNRYFGLMSEAVHGTQGVVDKFIGDSVMAYWGEPFSPAGENAILACQSSLDQLAKLEIFRRELPEITGLRKNLPVMDLRIGLATGEVVAGNIGSEETRSYTVIGDTTNLASRLESANRHYGTRILVCGETRRVAAAKFVFREIDSIQVKGKDEPVSIYELTGLRDPADLEISHLHEIFGRGLQAYRHQKWDEAEKAFADAEKLGDSPAKVFRQRLAQLRSSPLRPEWDGVWHLSEK